MARLGSPPCCAAGSMTASVRLASLRQPTTARTGARWRPDAPRRLFWSALLPPEASAAGCLVSRPCSRRLLEAWSWPARDSSLGHARARIAPASKTRIRPKSGCRRRPVLPKHTVVSRNKRCGVFQHTTTRQAKRLATCAATPALAAENRGRARWPLRLVKARPRTQSPRPDHSARRRTSRNRSARKR